MFGKAISSNCWQEKSKFCIFGFLFNGIFFLHPKLEMLGNHKRGLDRSYQLETQVTFYTSYLLRRTKLLNIFSNIFLKEDKSAKIITLHSHQDNRLHVLQKKKSKKHFFSQT
jgi:hypothetical protein